MLIFLPKSFLTIISFIIFLFILFFWNFYNLLIMSIQIMNINSIVECILLELFRMTLIMFKWIIVLIKI